MTPGRDGRLASYRRVRLRATSKGGPSPAEPSLGTRERRPLVRSRPSTTADGREDPNGSETPPFQALASGNSPGRRSRNTLAEETISGRKGQVGSNGGVTQASRSAAMGADLAVQTRKEEDMRHPVQLWTDPAFAEESLRRLRDEYKRHISAGPNKLAVKTVRKYMQDLDDFLRSLERHGLPLVLGSVTADALSQWTGDQEARGNSPHSITGRVISVKVFANSFIHKTLELTTLDLLRKVQRPNPTLPPREILTQEEYDRVLASYDLDTFEDIRDRAIIATFAATGLRLEAVRTLPLSSYDRITGEFTAHEKGDVVRLGRLSPRTMKFLREYLARRPRNALTDQLWVTGRGEPLSNGGFNMVIRRARRRSGISRMHAHLFRHGMAQHAADNGADIGTIQTLLGHKSPAMSRRYAGEALNRQGARLMVQFSPIG